MNKLNIRNDVVQEIISNPPNRILRWGNTLLFAIFLIIFFISWIIKYPDIVKGEVIITTKIEPVKVKNKVEGNIKKLYKCNGDNVKKGEIIIEIENPLNNESFLFLNNLLHKIQKYLNGDIDNIKNLDFEHKNLVFGNAQNEFNLLRENMEKYINLKKDGFYEKSKKQLEIQIQDFDLLGKISNEEYINKQKILKNSKIQFNASKLLYKENIISRKDYFEEEKKLLCANREVLNQKQVCIKNRISKNNLKKELEDLVYNHQSDLRKLKEDIKSSINNINNILISWKHNYILKAPLSGRVYFYDNIKKGRLIKNSEELFIIVPKNEKYLAKIKLQPQGLGRVKINQKARIKLYEYPSHEFGFINSKVEKISFVSKDDQYWGLLKLENGLITNYKKKLNFRNCA